MDEMRDIEYERWDNGMATLLDTAYVDDNERVLDRDRMAEVMNDPRLLGRIWAMHHELCRTSLEYTDDVYVAGDNPVFGPNADKDYWISEKELVLMMGKQNMEWFF